MAFPIATLEFAPQWKGLYRRRQLQADSEMYASQLYNLEVREGVMRKRGGTQILNGAGTYVRQFVNNDTFIDVSSTHGFRIGDVITVREPSGNTYTRTIVDIFTGNYIKVNTALTASYGSAVIVQRQAGTSDFIKGLFQARYQRGVSPIITSFLDNGVVAWGYAGGREHRLIPTLRAQTTVDVNWGSNHTGTLTTVQGLSVGDRLTFGIGGLITEIIEITPITRTIKVSPVLGSSPLAGTTVSFYPTELYDNLIGALKLSGGQMAERAILASKDTAPVSVHLGHIAQTSGAWTTTTGPFTTLDLAKMGRSWFTFVAGNQVLIEMDDGDGKQLYLRAVSGASGTVNAGTLLLTQALPFAPPVGSRITQIFVARVGVGPPLTAPSLGQTGTGVLLGTFSYRFKFERYLGGDAESEASPSAPVTIVTTGAQVNVGGIPVSPDPTVTWVSIWRTFANSVGTYYRVGGVPNGTTTFTDNTPDIALIEAMREFVDNPALDQMGVVVPWPHAIRMMGIVFPSDITHGRAASPTAPTQGRQPSRVVYSDGPDALKANLRPESWPLDNSLFVGLDSDDSPRGIAPFFDSVLIFCERSIWRLEGIPPDIKIEPVNFRQDGTGLGVANHQQIVVDQNDCLFPGPDGVYMLNRFEGVQSGFQSQRLSRAIDNDFTQTSYERHDPYAFALFFREKRQYRLIKKIDQWYYMYVYQFDGDVGGDPYGWALWAITPWFQATATRPDVYNEIPGNAEIIAGAIVTPEQFWTQQRFVVTDDAMLITDGGSILVMDMVDPWDTGGQPSSLIYTDTRLTQDYGCAPYTGLYQTTVLYPAGLGGVARGRWVDIGILSLDQTPIAGVFPQSGILIRVEPELIGQIFYQTPPVLTQFPRDALGSIPPYQRFMTLKRGRSHLIRIEDTSRDALFGISHLSYSYQRLPDEAALETFSETLTP